MPKISIIIPTYRPQNYLYDCLESISKQNFKDFELIIVLNGCFEPYKTSISNWLDELNLSHISRLIHIDEGNVSKARNTGIDISSGSFITFIDDDDLISENYLEELNRNSIVNGITISNIALLKNGRVDYDYPVSRAFESLKKNGYKSIYNLRRVLNGPWMKLFSRTVIADVRFKPSIKLGEDALFSFSLSKNIKGIRFTDTSAVYYYRIQSNSSWDKKSNSEVLRNLSILLWSYIKTYMETPLKYDFRFFLNRFFAVISTTVIFFVQKLRRRLFPNN